MAEQSFSLTDLAVPFGDDDLEWRVGQCGFSESGKPWAKLLAYVSNRAIQQRLDDVVGPENWRNEYLPLPNADHTKGCQCGISIRINGEWVTKWDGADNTATEAVKGGLSDAMKRAAVQWGIGRHLYGLGTSWATFTPDKKKAYSTSLIKDANGSKQQWHSWIPPKLKEVGVRKLFGASDDKRTSAERLETITEAIGLTKSLAQLEAYESRINVLHDDEILTDEDRRKAISVLAARRGQLKAPTTEAAKALEGSNE